MYKLQTFTNKNKNCNAFGSAALIARPFYGRYVKIETQVSLSCED